jgi:hypothetical protein
MHGPLKNTEGLCKFQPLSRYKKAYLILSVLFLISRVKGSRVVSDVVQHNKGLDHQNPYIVILCDVIFSFNYRHSKCVWKCSAYDAVKAFSLHWYYTFSTRLQVQLIFQAAIMQDAVVWLWYTVRSW